MMAIVMARISLLSITISFNQVITIFIKANGLVVYPKTSLNMLCRTQDLTELVEPRPAWINTNPTHNSPNGCTKAESILQCKYPMSMKHIAAAHRCKTLSHRYHVLGHTSIRRLLATLDIQYTYNQNVCQTGCLPKYFTNLQQTISASVIGHWKTHLQRL